MSVQDFPDWMTPAQQLTGAYENIAGEMASLIATGSTAGSPGGVPLLTFVNPIEQFNAQAFTAGVSQTFPATGTFTVFQIGYEGFIGIETSGATATVCHVRMKWQEAGNTTAVDDFWIYAGTTASEHFVFFQGPSKGGQLVITITCLTNNCTVSFSMLGNSRVYNVDKWRTSGGTFVSGAANGQDSFDMFGNVLTSHQSIPCAAGATQQYCLPFWVGKCFFQGSTASGLGDMQAFITETASTVQPTVFNAQSNSAGEIEATELWLPRGQCFLNLKNGNPGQQNLSAAIILAEY